MFLEERLFTEALPHLAFVAERDPWNVTAAEHLALALCEADRPNEAAPVIEHALALEDVRPELWRLAGLIAERCGRVDDARGYYEQALQRSPVKVELHHLLGDLDRRSGALESAIEHYRAALAQKPDFFPSQNNLAATLKLLGRVAEAIDAYEKIIETAPGAIEPRCHLALCLADIGRFNEALNQLRAAQRLAPDHPHVHECMGRVQFCRGAHQEARKSFAAALRQNPRATQARVMLGTLSVIEEDFRQAEAEFRAALCESPHDMNAVSGLVSRLEEREAIDEARRLLEPLARKSPMAPLWRLRSRTVCPTLFESDAEITEYRDALQSALDDCLNARLSVGADQLVRMGLMPPFHLPFHGRDDRPLKETFGRAVAAMTARLAPWEPKRSSPQGPVRVGFVVLRNEKAFVRSIGGLIDRFSPDRIEATILAPHASQPLLRSAFKEKRVRFASLPAQLSTCVSAIRAMNLDVVYYFEVGTTPIGYQLAHQRLAPVQCTSWGIQVTSGVPAIDVYISSAAIETVDADEHYTERLIRLPTMLGWWEPTFRPVPSVDKSACGAPAGSHVYLCPQQLGKFTPGFDEILGRILDADGAGRIVITEGTRPTLVDKLRARLHRSIGPNAERILFLPQQKGLDYARMLAAADVLLDPPAFGGVNTTLDAIAVGKAIVTLPSPFQRGRYTSGCLRTMGMTETIVGSIDEYVERAVRIACDAELRRSLEELTVERREVLCRNQASVVELEELLVRLGHGDISP